MIEAYAFLAAFMVQILTTSVLYPTWFIRYARAQASRLPAELIAQMYPDVDLLRAQERFLIRYRALHAGIAVLGLLLLAGLFSYMQRPDWGKAPVMILVTVYFLVAQVLPLLVLVALGVKFNKEHKRSLPEEKKRKASLQRRGLFDFVSPFAVAVAVLGYFLFIAFVLYIWQDPLPGSAALITIAGVTMVYVLCALVGYVVLYGKNKNPLMTHETRMHAISVTVKSGVYTCIATVTFISLNFTLRLLDLQRWEPFALSLFYVACALLASMGVIRSQRLPELSSTV
jgi:MFS family permease